MDDMLDDGEKHIRKMDSLGAILSIMIKGISFFKSGFFFFGGGYLGTEGERERESYVHWQKPGARNSMVLRRRWWTQALECHLLLHRVH